MSTSQIKEELIKHIESADDDFLRIVHAMMEAYVEQRKEVVGYRSDGEAISPSGLKQIAEEGRAEIKKGNYKSIDDLEKEGEKW